MARIESKSPVLVLAPTGIAAFNIKETTIHSTLFILIITNNKHLDLNWEGLKQLQDKLQDVKYIIVDEKSMIGRQMLGLINMGLQ